MKTERSRNLNKDEYAIGIEIDKLCVRAVLVNNRLEPVNNLKFSTNDIKSISARCIDLVEELIKKPGIPSDNIKAIGIGADPKFVSVAKKIEKKFKIRAFYGGNHTCAALGEICSNPEAGCIEDIIYVYSDLGAGVALKGGNVKALPQEVSRYLEPWDASFGIAEIAKREVARGVGTKIVTVAGGRMENINNTVVSEAARQNDEVALNIMHSIGVTLGMRIAYLVNLSSPQVVILGGGLEKTETLLAEPITNTVKKLALRSKSESLKIVLGKAGEDAVSIGAASLAVREIFWPRSETSALSKHRGLINLQ